MADGETPVKKSDLKVRAASAVVMVLVAGLAIWLGGWAWIALVIAASPLIATAHSLLRTPDRFTARRIASPLTGCVSGPSSGTTTRPASRASRAMPSAAEILAEHSATGSSPTASGNVSK